MGAKLSVLIKSPDRLTTREKLGINQEQYASFCRISKSMLSMIEIQKRDWPLSKFNNAEMEVAFHKAETESPDISEFEKAEPWEKKRWEKQLQKLTMDEFRLERDLEKMAFVYETGIRLLKTCRVLRAKFTNPDSIEVKLLNLWEAEGQMKLRLNNPNKQTLLQLQLEANRKEKAVVEGVIGEFGAGE